MSNKLTNQQLTAKLKKMARLSREFLVVQQEVIDHSIEVYGYEPMEVDNDEFIDACTGSAGSCPGMNANQFHRSMKESIELKFKGCK